MFWGTNRKGFSLIRSLLVSKEIINKDELILEKEIGISMCILNAGYNITCILPLYQHDYRQRERWLEYSHINRGINGDVWYPNAYCGRSLHPSETIFRKTNRGVPFDG